MKRYSFYVLSILLLGCIGVGIFRSVVGKDMGRGRAATSAVHQKSLYVLEVFTPIYYRQGDSLEGLFGGTPHVGKWIEEIDMARQDKNIIGLLLRINSPGGAIAATQEMYEALCRFKESGKKIVVSVLDICASGAYYISLPADEIVVNKGSIVGSIGVLVGSMEYSDLMKKLGIRLNVIKSGRDKDILSPGRRMTARERNNLQRLVDEMHKEFVEVLIKWRGDHAEEARLRRVANGMIYSSSQAKSYGLVDTIGDFEAAKIALARHCGMDIDELNVITKTNKLDLKNLFKMRSLLNLISHGPLMPAILSPHSTGLLEYR